MMQPAAPLSPADLKDLQRRGIPVEKFLADLALFEKGPRHVTIDRPCTIGDGLRALGPEEMARYSSLFDEAARNGRVSRFVPASGAATRMFQHLLAMLSLPGPLTRERLDDQTPEARLTLELIEYIQHFAFYDDLSHVLSRQGLSVSACRSRNDFSPLLRCLVSSEGLDYGAKPKALLKFHRYSDHSRTAMEEHIAETMSYALDRDGRCRLHVTVSPEHRPAFETLIESLRFQYSSAGVDLEVSISSQKSSTDTPAADDHNAPVRDEHGRLVFRPAGHGALIDNLNDMDGDITFIKNIDNVVPDRLKDPTILYKKTLGGYLVELQNRIFDFLRDLDREVKPAQLDSIEQFCRNQFGFQARPPLDISGRAAQVKHFLNRPLRVCGMVENQGEPGGGPFWMRSTDGTLSLQIVEQSQINLDSPDQKKRFDASTHFNPVDLVCGLRDYTGRRFDLREYIDPSTAFISVKSKDGRMVKAIELPGLWNGSMAHWNTVFVEVPLITFNPVKIVNDLLRPEHR